MRGYRAYLALIVVLAVLGGCGGGSEESSISLPPTESAAPEPAPDPTASWPAKPLLGTWTGTLRFVTPGCSEGPLPDRPQSISITSNDGYSFTVVMAPSLTSDTGSSDTRLEWIGEPRFSIRLYGMTPYWDLNFNVIAPGQAEVTYVHNINYTQAACMTDKWSGVLTRD